MTMMKSTKYRKHRASKYDHPSRGTSCGDKTARQEVERRIGRALDNATLVTRHTRTQWVFCEPR